MPYRLAYRVEVIFSIEALRLLFTNNSRYKNKRLKKKPGSGTFSEGWEIPCCPLRWQHGVNPENRALGIVFADVFQVKASHRAKCKAVWEGP